MYVTEKEYEIYYYEVDLNKNLRVESLINFLQDIFVYRAEELGCGVEYVASINLTWIVSKWDIKIYKLPQYRDKVKIKIIPFAYRRSLMNIKFEVLNEEDEIICEALSLWILMDTINNRLCNYKSEKVRELYGLSLTNNKVLNLNKILLPSVINKVDIIHTRYTDLDTNGHVNNVKYLEWCLRNIPDEVLQNYQIKNIKISYKNQCKIGKVVYVNVDKKVTDDCVKYIHSVTDENDEILVLSETEWTNKL